MDLKPMGCTDGRHWEPEDKAAADSMEPEAKVRPLTTAMRRPYIVDQLLKGPGNWWNCNWWKVALALYGILVVGTALTIVTSGGFLAMLPPIMEALAAIFIGVMAARMDAEVQAYLKAAWGGPGKVADLEGGARHLAKALAIGSIELLFNVIFKAGAIFKSIKGTVAGWLGKARAWLAKMALSGSRFGKTVTGIAKGVSKVGTGVMKIPKAIGKVVVQKGKYVFQGLKKGFSKGAKSLRELRDRILKVVKVKRIFVVRTGWWFEIWAEVNPLFMLFEGPIVQRESAGAVRNPGARGGLRVGEEVTIDGERALVIGIRDSLEEGSSNLASNFARQLIENPAFKKALEELVLFARTSGNLNVEKLIFGLSRIPKGELDDVFQSIMHYRGVQGIGRVVEDLARSGNFPKGARWVLRYLRLNGKVVTTLEALVEEGGLRRIYDALIGGVHHEFKSWSQFFKDSFKRQFLTDLRLSQKFKWVFTDEMSKEFIHKSIRDILTNKEWRLGLSPKELEQIDDILIEMDEVFEVASLASGKTL